MKTYKLSIEEEQLIIMTLLNMIREIEEEGYDIDVELSKYELDMIKKIQSLLIKFGVNYKEVF